MTVRFSLPRRHLFVLEFLLYAILTTLALHATWLTWPDDLIDFSRELYLPWRVSCGDVLYRDLAYDFGPLSVYTNAALFALLGRPSIHALFALNFAFWTATLLALRAILRRLAHPAVAALAVCAFILLFSFNRYTGVGNENYLSPYSHELPRGFLLAILSLLSLDSGLKKSSWKLSCLSGFLLGLSLFAKPEIALAAVSSVAVLFLANFSWKRGRGACGRGLETPSLSICLLWPFALGVLVALSAVLLPLSFALNSFPRAFLNGFLNLYLDCFNRSLSALPYYQATTGLDAPLTNAIRLLAGGVLASLPFLAAGFIPKCRMRNVQIMVAILLVSASGVIGFFAFWPLNYALPLAPAAFLSVTLFRCWRRHPAPGGTSSPPVASSAGCPPHGRDGDDALAAAFSILALALVSKIALHAGISHYGFVLALPAFCCAVLLAFYPPCPPVRTLLAATLVLAFTAAGITHSARRLALEQIATPIHDGTCRARPAEAEISNGALDWIRANTAPDSTLAVLPEGAILNVLSGRPNPTPYVYLTQPDWLRFDPAAILAAYSNSPPDTLVLVDIHAKSKFGIDYARPLMAFLDPLYTPAITFDIRTSSSTNTALLIATRNPPHP